MTLTLSISSYRDLEIDFQVPGSYKCKGSAWKVQSSFFVLLIYMVSKTFMEWFIERTVITIIAIAKMKPRAEFEDNPWWFSRQKGVEWEDLWKKPIDLLTF